MHRLYVEISITKSNFGKGAPLREMHQKKNPSKLRASRDEKKVEFFL
jgi:hypothetical protein